MEGGGAGYAAEVGQTGEVLEVRTDPDGQLKLWRLVGELREMTENGERGESVPDANPTLWEFVGELQERPVQPILAVEGLLSDVVESEISEQLNKAVVNVDSGGLVSDNGTTEEAAVVDVEDDAKSHCSAQTEIIFNDMSETSTPEVITLDDENDDEESTEKPVIHPDTLEMAIAQLVNMYIDEMYFYLGTDVGKQLRWGQLDITSNRAKEPEFMDTPGLDIFGVPLNKKVTMTCKCPKCSQKVGASRFAVHLENCMGLGRASRRKAVNANNSKNNSESGIPMGEESSKSVGQAAAPGPEPEPRVMTVHRTL